MQVGGRGGRRRRASAARRGHAHVHLPPPPDACMVPGRILIHDPRHCTVHGWTAVLRIEDYPRSEMLPAIVSSYSTQYGWMNFNRDEAGPSSASSSRMPAPMAAPPARFPTPPPTMAARRGAPPFYNSNTAAAGPSDSIAPPSPPPAT
ncbi:unnamed protein product, partial [Urochloa humidicola]